jgi:hypothetical protein
MEPQPFPHWRRFPKASLQLRLILEQGRHRLPGVPRSGGSVMDARHDRRSCLAAPAPPRQQPRPAPLPALPSTGSVRARPASRPSSFTPPQPCLRRGARSRGAPGPGPSRSTPLPGCASAGAKERISTRCSEQRARKGYPESRPWEEMS